MPPKHFVCKQCGQCCTELTGGYLGTVNRKQLRAWLKEAPDYVGDWVQYIGYGLYDYFISPTTGEYATRCPWLRNYKADRYLKKGFRCQIQDNKPPTCVEFPLTVSHALACNCLGFSHLSDEQVEALLAAEKKLDDPPSGNEG